MAADGKHRTNLDGANIVHGGAVYDIKQNGDAVVVGRPHTYRWESGEKIRTYRNWTDGEKSSVEALLHSIYREQQVCITFEE